MLKKILEKYGKNELLDLIKIIRGQAYNRITIYTIGGGITILTSPWWIEILENFLGKELNIPLTDSLTKWLGFILIIVSLIYNYTMSRLFNSNLIKDYNDRHIIHDEKVFNSFPINQKIIEDLIIDLSSLNRIDGEKWKYLINLRAYYSAAENTFKIKEISQKILSFSSQLEVLIQDINNSTFDKKIKKIHSDNEGYSLESIDPSSYFYYSFIRKEEINSVLENCKKLLMLYIEFRTTLKDEISI